MEINKVYNESCLDTMSRMSDNFIDLTVTSPPYDGLRVYNGYSFPFEEIAKELYRVTKVGGVLVWVVADQTIEGNESGTSFKQALYFKEIGFNLGDTMIWRKVNPFNFGSNHFYPQSFEYMFVFTKGKLKTSNLIRDREVKSKGMTFIEIHRRGDYMERGKSVRTLDELGKKHNVWDIPVQSVENHPAPFPEKLVSDHIVSWSNKGELVYDPFMGSGTTAKMSILNLRNWIGSEISEEYVSLANERLKEINYDWIF
jgi:site-specific DNA-methyltransferase (adenine-specific)